jgi:hypothetical protein
MQDLFLKQKGLMQLTKPTQFVDDILDRPVQRCVDLVNLEAYLLFQRAYSLFQSSSIVLHFVLRIFHGKQESTQRAGLSSQACIQQILNGYEPAAYAYLA